MGSGGGASLGPPGRLRTAPAAPAAPPTGGRALDRQQQRSGWPASRGEAEALGRDPRGHGWPRRSSWVFLSRVVRTGVRSRTWITRAIKPVGRLVPVSSTRCRACTPGLSTWSSSTALIGSTRFEVGFPLRCLQRLSRPYIAMLHRRWRDDSSTRGTSIPVLSY